MKTLIIIPSRLSASRLPGKPLLKINGISIISHVFKRAEKANIGDVIVAAEDQEIVDDVKKNDGNAILTSKNHKTGTDRIFEAFSLLNLKNIDLIMNIQGDEPQIDIKDIINDTIKDREDFRQFVNNNDSINQANLFISRSKSLVNEYYKNIFEWLDNCEKIFGFNLSGYGKIRIYGFLAERYLPFWFNIYAKCLEWPIVFNDLTKENFE